jgi:hypothetical protein
MEKNGGEDAHTCSKASILAAVTISVGITSTSNLNYEI